MVTKEQALTEDNFHFGTCSKHIGPRGGVKIKVVKVRRSGMTKTWKRSPERFRTPIKYGMCESSYIREDNCDRFHCAKDCPITQE